MGCIILIHYIYLTFDFIFSNLYLYKNRNLVMDIYIAICKDVHIDDDIKVFTDSEKAIQYCKNFVPKRCALEEQELTDSMIYDNWIYYATYNEENSVRVEKSKLIE